MKMKKLLFLVIIIALVACDTTGEQLTNAGTQPEMFEPADNAVLNISFITFKWLSVADAKTYTLEISRNPEFTDLYFQYTMEGPGTQKVTNIFENGKFYWRVYADTTDVGNLIYFMLTMDAPNNDTPGHTKVVP